MVKMVKSKREFVCSKCGYKAIKFSGYCGGCKAAGTMKEHVLIPVKTASQRVRSLQRRAKNSERDIAKRMIAADGADPLYKNIASSSGRVGFITGLQFDAISKNYVIEAKNRVLPLWLVKAWVQILQIAVDRNKHALLHLDPPNMQKEFPINGGKRKTDTMALITQTRHEELIIRERQRLRVEEIILSSDSNLSKLRQIRELLGLL